jgi:hypothetical protein
LLGSTLALIPIGATVVLLMLLRPDVMTAFWFGVGRLAELVIMPLLLLLSWLASLLPAAGGPLEPPPARPRPPARGPTIEELARQQAAPDWIPYVALTLVLVVVLFMAAAILRLLLESEVVMRPVGRRPEQEPGVSVERSGNAGQDARRLIGWLLGWLRMRLLRSPPQHTRQGADPGSESAWQAYRSLLAWAAQHGVQRRPADTTQQLQSRLLDREPGAADAVGLVTSTFESERYGREPPPADRLRRVQAALRQLFGSM